MKTLPQTPKSQLLAPMAHKKAVKRVNHGDVRMDEYAWLEKRDDPKVAEYVAAENAYADRLMAPTKGLQNKLVKAIRSRIKEDDLSVPVKDGEYYYYTRVRKGKPYAIHCRTRGKRGKEEIILDENKLARGKKFFSLGACEVSPDHTLIAYTIDITGDERYTLYVRNIETGKLFNGIIPAVESVAWAEDGKYVWYTKEEHPYPPRKVYRHRLGENHIHDVLVYEEKNLQWSVSIDKTRSKKFLIISSCNFETSEERFIPADEPLARPRLIAARKNKVIYSVEHHNGHFYIITNERAVNFKVMRVSIDDPRRSMWREWLPYNKASAVEGLLAFENFMVLMVRERGAEQICVCRDTEKQRWEKIDVPEDEHSLALNEDIEYDAPFFRFSYQSAVTPRMVYDYHVADKKLTVRKKQEVPRWNPDEYYSERVWVKSGEVKIPVSLSYHKKYKRNGAAPMLLDAYGSYGISSDPYFSIARTALLERGWIIATAHVRGGGEMGSSWHKAAYHMTKHRTYHDVIAVADYLVRNNYTSRDRLALTGGSAGGMTMGAVLNMRPDLCAVAIVHVPNADTVNSMLDETLGGTRLHYDELGDPRKPKEYFYLKKWSPYENVKKADYPAMLVRASMHDIRTPYWEAAKWVARLRAKKTDDNTLMLKIEMNAGHGGKSGRYAWINERAYDYAFLIEMFGV